MTLEKSFFIRNLWMYYIAFWVAVTAIQFALQYGVYDQDLTVATADCLVSNFIFALLGNIYEKLSEDQLEELGVIDILIIPVGGNGYTLDATGAALLTRKIDPKVVIPVHYADSAVKYEVAQDTLDTFVKELGASVETTAKYKVKGPQAIPAALTVVELTRV